MIEIKALRGGDVATAQLDDAAFPARMNPVVLREAVLMYEANRRVGTASTKTRSQIVGSTKKIYRQKGTGRARHGDRKAPIFRGGGVAHGPKPRDYSYALPKKALRRALRIAFAGKLADGEVMRWEGALPVEDKPSTKAVRQALEKLGAADGALLVGGATVSPNLLLSVRNLPRVRVLPASEVTAYDLVRHRWCVLLDGAWEDLLARLDAAGLPGDTSQPAEAEGSAS